MKITDEQLLDLIWDEILSKIARRTITYHIGGYLGTYSEEEIRHKYNLGLCFFSSISIEEIKDNAPLCESQLKLRVKRLVKKGLLVSTSANYFTFAHFTFASEKLLEIAVLAVKYWQAAGLPYGYDDKDKHRQCVPLDTFDFPALSLDCHFMLKQQYPTYKEIK